MGQTLTHGIYLPDEGERNCYSGLAANWQLLDGAVGTVAEHTTALAGKAGLTANNTFSGDNTFSKTVAIEKSTDSGNFLTLKNTTAELGSIPASTLSATIAYKDKNDENLGYMGVFYDTDGSNRFRLFVGNKFTSGAPSTSGTADYAYFGLKLNTDKSKEGILRASFRPYDNNTYDLGSSSYKWKTLNGINPGALSLPNLTANSPSTQNPPNGWISIDTTDWDKTGNLISYIPPVDGWISIITDNSSAANYIRCAYDNGDILAKANGNGYAQGLSVFLPVLKNVQIGIRLVCTTIGTAKLYPCQGNV